MDRWTNRALGCAWLLVGCAEAIDPAPLRINEIVADNEGVWVDERGEVEDVVELVNVGAERILLSDYSLADRDDDLVLLPAISLGPNERIVFFADRELDEGEMHLPFKLASDGERVYLRDRDGTLRDRVEFGALPTDHGYARFPDGEGAFAVCRYASPSRANGERCGPAPRETIEGESYASFELPSPYPAIPSPLHISEISLEAGFVELANVSTANVALEEYALGFDPQAPGMPYPSRGELHAIALDGGPLGPGEHRAFALSPAEVTALGANGEGVAQLFRGDALIDRVDFSAWPAGASLERTAESGGGLRFCIGATPDQPNRACVPATSRPDLGRLRNLRSPEDFTALAAGGTEIGLRSIKVVIDMQAGDAVHFLGSRRWDLHYTFVREEIEHLEHLDRCDPADATLFFAGWSLFSREQYYQVETRRYLLANLVEHVASGHRTLEFETGDQIDPAQMRRAYLAVAAHVDRPEEWFLRPLSAEQNQKLRALEGSVPILAYEAPLSGLTLQPLSPGVGFGTLEYIEAADLAHAALGLHTIVVTNDVPNDVPLIGGLITEAFQTPLSHVNVLSRGRGTPNMALAHARTDSRLANLWNTLVRFEVTEGGFDVRAATADEAEAFWANKRPSGPPLSPRVELELRGVVPLSNRGMSDIPAIGAKAAQLAELAKVVSQRATCPGPIPTPRDPFAIAIVHSIEHFETSGARTLLASWRDDPAFRTDSRVRADALARVRDAIMNAPVDPELLSEVEAAVAERFGGERVRFRSSSNVEDLQTFNGAGLYTSISAELDDPERSVEDAIRTVWASLWNARAYDERVLANIDDTTVGMGVLVHLAHLDEAANGVGVSRNVFDPTRGDIYYFDNQVGEVSVANPAPGVGTEQVFYRFGRNPRIVRQSHSTLTRFDVLSERELDQLACVMAAAHDGLRPLLDPLGTQRWYAIDVEYKFTRDERALVFKQARPYSFGTTTIPADCREF